MARHKEKRKKKVKANHISTKNNINTNVGIFTWKNVGGHMELNKRMSCQMASVFCEDNTKF